MIDPASLEPGPTICARPSLPDAVQSHLGERLRSLYLLEDTVTSQRLNELLERLEAILAARGEALTVEVRTGLVEAMPKLQRFAMSLAKDFIQAEDLVQETLMKGWRYRHLYQPGTNLEAWLFMILRNLFYTQCRKQGRETEDPNDEQAARLSIAPTQDDRLDLQDMRIAMKQLPPDQHDTLILVVINGISYEEAAKIMNCKIGTIKSRINRARAQLVKLLGYGASDLGVQNIYQAATQSSRGELK